MNKLVYGALALTLTGTPALATDTGWSGLDKEIESLSTSLSAAEESGPKIGGWIKSSYRHSSDDFYTGGMGMPDQSGFQLDSVRIDVSGDVSDNYGYKISFDLATGNGPGHGASPNGAGTLRDAYVTWRIAEGIKGRMGRFKEPVLRSGLVSDQYLQFIERTALGEVFKMRDLGLSVNGSFDVLDWIVAFQDGGDGQADEHKYSVRLSATLAGTAGGKMMEGAYGAGEGTTVNVGAAFQDDTFLDDGQVIAVDAVLVMGPFSLSAEVVDFDDGDAGTFGRTVFISDAAGTTPWDATATYLVTPDWEAALRYEDADDSDDTISYVLGVNYYIHGHNLKWQAQWRRIETDNAVGDSDQVGVGLTLAF